MPLLSWQGIKKTILGMAQQSIEVQCCAMGVDIEWESLVKLSASDVIQLSILRVWSHIQNDAR